MESTISRFTPQNQVEPQKVLIKTAVFGGGHRVSVISFRECFKFVIPHVVNGNPLVRSEWIPD
jgi:hypothetical protein